MRKKLGDRTIRNLHYAEMNALLFKAETKHGGTAGTIQIPEDFRDATFFERTESNDLISAQGYKVLTEEELEFRAFENMWLQIQNLSTVREYMTANPDQEVHIISYHPASHNNSHGSQWIFVLKN